MTPLSLPLVAGLHRALLERGAWPLIRLAPSVLVDDFYRHGTERHLDSFAPLELVEVQRADAVIGIDAPVNTQALAGIDPALIARVARARSSVQEARLALRWCGTVWPTPALAQQARMSEGDYAAFVERALFLDRPDPVAAWRELSATARRGGRPPDDSARDPDRGRRDRPAPPRRGSHLDQLQRPAQHAERRGLHGPDRGFGQRDDPVHRPLESARRRRRRRRADLRGREGGRAPPPSAARTTSTPRSPPTPAPASSASSGSGRTPASTARPARPCSTRRWPEPSTSRSAARIPRPAGETPQPCTGI